MKKTKNLLLLAFLSIFLTSCSKDDSPSSSTDDSSSAKEWPMTAKVNGTLWQMKNPFNSNFATHQLFDYYPTDDFILLQGRQGTFGLDEFQIEIKKTDLAVGTYPVGIETYDGTKSHIEFLYNSFPTNQYVVEGSINITAVNLTNKTVKGTFNCKCANERAPISSSNPVTNTITEGTFNYKYDVEY